MYNCIEKFDRLYLLAILIRNEFLISSLGPKKGCRIFKFDGNGTALVSKGSGTCFAVVGSLRLIVTAAVGVTLTEFYLFMKTHEKMFQ